MNIVLGGGLAGLAAGHRLTAAGFPAVILEKGLRVGGLARTISHGGFKFDLGGHRFLTDNERIMALVSRPPSSVTTIFFSGVSSSFDTS